jgi:SAM-dependent methyltransferase
MLKDFLAQAGIYNQFARLVGSTNGLPLHIRRHIRPRAGDRVLDIGCGPAEILDALPAVDYYGFDLSPTYIESARRRFGTRGQFQVAAVNMDLVGKYHGFDLVLATGVLHHLNDAEALDLFRVARAALKPGGRLVTRDGCFVPGQPAIVRFLLRQDRGQYVRDEAAYVALARQVFSAVKPVIATDLLRIPYTHLIMECHAVET